MIRCILGCLFAAVLLLALPAVAGPSSHDTPAITETASHAPLVLVEPSHARHHVDGVVLGRYVNEPALELAVLDEDRDELAGVDRDKDALVADRYRFLREHPPAILRGADPGRHRMSLATNATSAVHVTRG